jgi:hypothetical protein
MLYEIIVPAGVSPGETFQVQVGSNAFDVVVPDGCGAGSNLELELPVDDTIETDAPAMVEVEVPTGCHAGDEFMVETPDGLVAVVVPDGSSPGTLLSIALPAPAELQLDKPKTEPPFIDSSPRSVRATLEELPAMESSGWEERPVTAAEPVDENEESFGPDGFDFEDSYLIQRSDGSYTEGYLQKYDSASFLYYVLIPRAGFKWVSREQIELNTVHD